MTSFLHHHFKCDSATLFIIERASMKRFKSVSENSFIALLNSRAIFNKKPTVSSLRGLYTGMPAPSWEDSTPLQYQIDQYLYA